MMIKKHTKLLWILSFTGALLVALLIIVFLGKLMMPKYMDDVVEGALIAEYYKEEKNHDVIFIGDCEVYENISPITLYEDYKIKSYIRGSAQQLIWQSYYLLEETLRYEKPKVVVFNILSMMYGKPQNEAYNRMTLDGMKWSKSKISAIKASMTEGEEFIEYLFPLFRYHDRWNHLNSSDFKYLFKKDQISHNGYYMRVDVKPVSTVPRPRKLTNYQFSDICYEYLDKITTLCKENSVELILMKAPSIYPYWYPEWDAQIKEYAKENDLDYYNFLDLVEEIGIDYNTDTYDAGLHLNLSGATKLSHYLGKVLDDKYDFRTNNENNDNWAEKIQFYYEKKSAEEEKYNISQ